MQNQAVLELSVKDYAAQRGKTVQAVYQQMKRKENAAELEGHVTSRYVGNKRVKFLDEVAISILDKGSQSAPVIIQKNNLEQKLIEVEGEKNTWEARAHRYEGQITLLKDLLAEKEKQLSLLAEPEAQIARLSDKMAEKDKSYQELEVELKSTSDELTEAKETIQKMKNATWWQRLRGFKG